MTNEKLYKVLGDINEKYVSEARAYQKAKKPVWAKWGVMAACLCLVVGLVIPSFIHEISTPQDGIGTESGCPPHIVIDNRKFFVSTHLSVSDELPDGFVAAGNIDTVGGFENCPYYLNPDIPEWVYVYHEVRTDGTVDATGTLTSTQPHNAYVRYVDERLRGKDLICYNGKYYISMWSADCYGETPDVTREYYDEMDSLYGKRIEGTVPNGFELAGTATFTGNDTIPTGSLASNEEEATVYYNPDDLAVIFVETHWFTATAEENGETRHDGFNVYIHYDCPFRTEAETIQFNDKTFNKSDLLPETIEWLDWYNGLTETERLSISYIPADIYKLCGYAKAEDVRFVESDIKDK